MPTPMTHAFAGAALAAIGAPREVPRRYWIVAVACAVLPDADVLAYFLRMAGSPWLHRGLSHSLPFALGLSLLATGVCRFRSDTLSNSGLKLWMTLAVICASHGLLDTLTDGGPGVALWAPLSDERYFCPWRPIIVAPITLNPVVFLGNGGGLVIASELILVWLPLGLIAAVARQRRGLRAP